MIRNNQHHRRNERLVGSFHRIPISEFVIKQGIGRAGDGELFELDKTIFLGYNPGFGSGYDLLLNSWCLDLVMLLNLNYPIIFTQANDYSVIQFPLNLTPLGLTWREQSF